MSTTEQNIKQNGKNHFNFKCFLLKINSLIKIEDI